MTASLVRIGTKITHDHSQPRQDARPLVIISTSKME